MPPPTTSTSNSRSRSCSIIAVRWNGTTAFNTRPDYVSGLVGMSPSRSPLIVFSAAQLDEHDTPPWHPENRGRLDAALAGVHEAGLGEATLWRVPELASTDDLTLVHDRR